MIRFDPQLPIFQQYFVVSGAGSQAFDKFDDSSLMDQCRLTLDRLENLRGRILIVSGGARGWDHFLIKVAQEMSYPYALIIPCPEYPHFYWGSRKSIDRQDHLGEWAEIESHAAQVCYVMTTLVGSNGLPGGANFDRNEALTKVAKFFLVWDSPSSGSQDTLLRVRRARIPYTIMNDSYKCVRR